MKADLDLGRGVRCCRVAAGMTQQQLAAVARVQQSTLSRIEKGTRVPTMDTLRKIAGALRVPLSVVTLASEDVEVLLGLPDDALAGLARVMLELVRGARS